MEKILSINTFINAFIYSWFSDAYFANILLLANAFRLVVITKIQLIIKC